MSELKTKYKNLVKKNTIDVEKAEKIYYLFIKNPSRGEIKLDINLGHSIYRMIKCEIDIVHCCTTFVLRNGCPTMSKGI